MSKQLPFLEQIAQYVINSHLDELDQLHLVFPNRRATLFFKKYLAQRLQKPIWTPQVMSIQDFVRQHKLCMFPDNIELVSKMYPIYQSLIGNKEERFEQFYFWGEMLLKDFSDIDAYMADAEKLFKVLKEQKEIDIYFGDFEEDQIQLIERFWKNFQTRDSKQKQQFIKNWEILFPLYSAFRDQLKAEGMAYDAMFYRTVAEQLMSGDLQLIDSTIVFAGFNALTKSEEVIISHYVQNKSAKIFWDFDRYYMESSYMEAGNFFRQYQKKAVFSKSFHLPFPDFINSNSPKVNITSCTDSISQLKAVGEKLAELVKAPSFDPNNTAIILADESLLLPLLHVIPEQVPAVNVTMGFPIKHSPFFSIVEELIDFQKQIRTNTKEKAYFNYKPTLSLLKTFIHKIEGAREIVEDLIKNNRIWVKEDFLKSNDKLKQLFRRIETGDFFGYTKEVLLLFADDQDDMHQAIIVHLFKQLNRLEDIIQKYFKSISWEALQALVRNVVSKIRIPFSGEPLNGLQIMGVLESRNLDFQHVFFISANEDQFPGSPSSNSYIPYNLRKVFGLPGIDQHAAIYSYLFYRLFHQASKLYFYYSAQGSGGKTAEVSRYLLQLQHESGLQIRKMVQTNEFDFKPIDAIGIEKSDAVMATLKDRLLLSSDNPYRLSPTALTSYLQCRLQFYWTYILSIGQTDEIQESIDGRIFGNLLHKSMEELYKPYKDKAITTKDFAEVKENIEEAVNKSFKDQMGMKGDANKFEYEGHQVLIANLVNELIRKILAIDEKSAPLKILGLEEKEIDFDVPVSVEGKAEKIGLKGTVDRIDETADAIRVIDYKSGKDEKEMPDFELFFDRDKKKYSKAPFQILFYALQVFKSENFKISADKKLQSGIYNLKELYKDDFDFRLIKEKQVVDDIAPLLPEFEAHLQRILQEIFDRSIPFDQTTNEDNCRFCIYKGVCHR